MGSQCYRAPLGIYSNYWGGVVFAPLVVAIGILAVLLSPFAIQRERGARPPDHGQPVRFPHEDVERPWTPFG
jgi:hypothetical protein